MGQFLSIDLCVLVNFSESLLTISPETGFDETGKVSFKNWCGLIYLLFFALSVFSVSFPAFSSQFVSVLLFFHLRFAFLFFILFSFLLGLLLDLFLLISSSSSSSELAPDVFNAHVVSVVSKFLPDDQTEGFQFSCPDKLLNFCSDRTSQSATFSIPPIAVFQAGVSISR